MLLALSGCSFPGTGPDAGTALSQLAGALSGGDVGGVDFVGDDGVAAAAYAEVTDGLDPTGGTVKVVPGAVTTDGDSAVGRLRWRWGLGAKTWSYETRVRLHQESTPNGSAWLVRWAPDAVEPSLEEDETLARTTIKAERGTILGAGGKPLVTQRPVLRVGIDKTTVEPAQVTRSANALARLVDIDAAAFTEQVVAAGPTAFVQALVYRHDDVPRALLRQVSDLPGGTAVSDRLPLAPSKDFASAILGTVGPATAELVKESGGRIEAGDDVGLSGLQKRYDEQLSGTPGTTVVALDDEGGRRTLFTVDADPGEPLRTTVDLAAQQAAQRVLADVASASALVAIRPSSGDLVAVASGPGSESYNTATFGQYAPGSTFKVVSALALLRAGLTTGSSVECPRTLVVDGKTFKNYDDYPASGIGAITLEDALASSCNTAFISQRDELGPQSLVEAAAALGLGVDHDVGFPAYFGEVGAAESETQAAASMIGQGTVLASPMAMATVVASVVKGSAVLPRLLPDVAVEAQAPDTPLTAGEAQRLRTMMRAVVERGSGSLLGDLPGGRVIAKTGTAEFGERRPLPTHAWMVAGRGDLAVAVFVERGKSGSGTAGPVLRDFLATVRMP